MPDLFAQSTDADGNVTYVPVEPDVITSLVKEHPLFNKVKGEAIERRHQLQDKKVEPDPTSEPVKVVEPALDKEALFKEFTDRLNEQRNQQTQAQQEKTAKLQEIITKHKLTDVAAEVLPALETAADPDVAAATFAKMRYQFGVPQGGVNPQVERRAAIENDPVIKAVQKRMANRR
jgi:hypothetical protein